MKRWSLALLAPALLGAGPQPLLVGVVHDQYGFPIAGAAVSAGTATTRTDERGTFALAGPGGGEVRIACDFCRTATFRAPGGEPLVAVIQRYERVADSAPTPRDVRALPYADSAALVALHPYAVLNQSSAVIPGSTVSLFGASTAWGGVLVDNGIPNYDFAAGTSPFAYLPPLTVQSIDVAGPQAAFQYGEDAGSGTFFTDTTPPQGLSAASLVGGTRALYAGAGGDDAAAEGAVGSSDTFSAQRIDGSAGFTNGDDRFSVSALTATNRLALPGSTLDQSFSGARAGYVHAAPVRVQAAAVVDAGGYDGAPYDGTGVSAGWSDASLSAGMTTPGAFHAFADVAARRSSGFYDFSQPAGAISGATTMLGADAGAAFSSGRLSGSAGVGGYALSYADTLQNGDAHNAFALPSATISYAPVPQFVATVSASDAYRITSLFEALNNTPPGASALERTSIDEADISYTDLRRVRADIVDVSGSVHASGATVAWQIAPSFTLRAWTLQYDRPDTGEAASVHSIWQTYENPNGGVRFDLIERRDLLDGAPNEHVEAALSLAVSPHLRWIAATQRVRTQRTYSAGLEITP